MSEARAKSGRDELHRPRVSGGRFTTQRTILTGNWTISSDSNNFIFLDPNGTNRDVTLPALSPDYVFWIFHIGSANTLTIKDAEGTSLVTLDQAEAALCAASEEEWALFSSDAIEADVPDVFKVMSDGSTTATADGIETFKFRAGGLLQVTVTENDVTHGDNLLIELADMAGLSIPGVAGNSSTTPAAITAASDGAVLRRSGTTLGFGKLDLTSATHFDNQVSIALGGTGQATQTAAYDALSPLTTKGDIEVHDGTNVIRVAVGTDGQVIEANSAAASGLNWVDANDHTHTSLDITDFLEAVGDSMAVVLQDGDGITFTYDDGADTLTVGSSKLAGIESGATADQTAGEIEAIVSHDNLVGFVANEHIDWTSTSSNFSTTGTVTGGQINANKSGSAATLLTYRTDDPGVSGNTVGQLNFNGLNDASEAVTYGWILATSTDASDGTEDGTLTFSLLEAGAYTVFLTLGNSAVTTNRDLSVTGTISGSSSITGTSLQAVRSGAEANLVTQRSDDPGVDTNTIGAWTMNALNDASEVLTYGWIQGVSADVSDGAENGTIVVAVVDGGSYSAKASFTATGINLLDATSITGTLTASAQTLNHRYSGGQAVHYIGRSDTHGDAAGIGVSSYIGKSSAAADVEYAKFFGYCELDNTTAEDGQWRVQTIRSGSQGQRLFVGAGLYHPSVTGGDYGNNTINFGAVYDDTNLLTCYPFDAYLDGDIDEAKWDALVPDQPIPAQMETVRDDDGKIVGEVEIAPASVKVRRHEEMRKFKARLGGDEDPLDLDKYINHWKTKRHLTSMPNESKFDPVAGKLAQGEWVQRLIETVEIQAIHIAELHERLKSVEARTARVLP